VSASYNLSCEQAATFNFQFTIANDGTPWNLTGYTATMTVRPFAGSSTTTIVCSTANGRIVLDTGNGRATVTISDDLTAEFTPGRYVYDFVFDSGSVVTRVLEGVFVVIAGVTGV
jgi:hypothetical protein